MTLFDLSYLGITWKLGFHEICVEVKSEPSGCLLNDGTMWAEENVIESSIENHS